MHLDENREPVVEVESTKSNEEVDAVGDQGKVDGLTDNSTKSDEDNDGLLEESSGSGDGTDIDVAAGATTGTISATSITLGNDLTAHVSSGGNSDGLNSEGDLAMDISDSPRTQDNDSHENESSQIPLLGGRDNYEQEMHLI